MLERVNSFTIVLHEPESGEEIEFDLPFSECLKTEEL